MLHLKSMVNVMEAMVLHGLHSLLVLFVKSIQDYLLVDLLHEFFLQFFAAPWFLFGRVDIVEVEAVLVDISIDHGLFKLFAPHLALFLFFDALLLFFLELLVFTGLGVLDVLLGDQGLDALDLGKGQVWVVHAGDLAMEWTSFAIDQVLGLVG